MDKIDFIQNRAIKKGNSVQVLNSEYLGIKNSDFKNFSLKIENAPEFGGSIFL